MIDKTKHKSVSRRAVLKAVGGLGVAASAGALAPRLFTPAVAGPAPKVRLAWTEVAACHSPLGFGVAKGIYQKHNIDVELFFQGASGQTLIQALATGKADAGAGLVGDWLKPLEQGFDVKLFVGSHGGCLRLLAPQQANVNSLQDVKGKTIAIYGLGTSPQIQFEVALAKIGLQAQTDYSWKVVPFELVGEAVVKGEADLVAHLDPWAYSIQKKNNFKLIADSQTGYFENRSCCVLGANGPFLKANRDAIRRLAEGNIEVHEYTAAHPDEVAAWYLENLKPAGLDLESLTTIIGHLVTHNHPIGKELVEQVRLGAEDLKFVNVLDKTTDPKEFAERVTENILA